MVQALSMGSYGISHMLPPPPGTSHYTILPTKFIDSVSPQEIKFNLPNEFDGLERIILQATGNLQRVMAAYFNRPVNVQHVKNVELPATPRSEGKDSFDSDDDNSDDATVVLKRFERQINLFCEEKFLYTADSVLIVRNQSVLDLIEKQKAGIAQIFWALQKLPNFKLHAIGRHGDEAGGSFWRDYTLSVDDLMYCHIREMFPADVFNSSSDDRQMGPCPTGTIWVATD
ncbi:hypothetical protein K450DRAFT_273689 [Umbelopsis ramanniana AG]|uniref:Uncharacterized protein n=1 Tax=Umbelopsis ramanniana AG TaxID=1314678 RepID=A0AAD5E784_UMBRA|nr:uncharacterized protein K450DRAFT_273689 [Umbelopsis ramanniana AG]KAI8577541.1 hypothetical protein K450DRAFT_273689 [Umbelopsis ramanniana AG]